MFLNKKKKKKKKKKFFFGFVTKNFLVNRTFFFKIPKAIDFIICLLCDFGTGVKKNGYLDRVFIKLDRVNNLVPPPVYIETHF